MIRENIDEGEIEKHTSLGLEILLYLIGQGIVEDELVLVLSGTLCYYLRQGNNEKKIVDLHKNILEVWHNVE